MGLQKASTITLSATTGGRAPVVERSASVLLILLTLAYAIAMVDRTILVLLIAPIEHDLHLSDTQFGLLQGVAFAMFYVVAGLPIGTLADRLPRVLVISGGMVLWSGATIASAFAGGFGSLFAARTAVAVGEAALNPAAYSLFSDLFTKERLGRAIGIFSTGAAIGTGLAYLVGGALLSRAHGQQDFILPLIGAVRIWQLAFLIAGAPGLVLAILIARLQEPARRVVNQVCAADGPTMVQFFVGHRRALLLIFGASGCQTLLLYAFMTWSPALLLRGHGLSGGQAGLILGLSNTVLGISGFYFGGYLADRWWKAGHRDAHMRVGFWAHVLVLPIGLIAALAAPTALAVPAVCILNFLQFGTGPATIAGLQLMTPPHLRGRTSALLMMATTLGGVGLGPVAVALLNDHVFGPVAVGRSLAVVVAVVAPIAILLFYLGRGALAGEIVKLNRAEAGRASGGPMEGEMFIQNAWHVASFAATVTHEIRAIRLLDRPLILWRTEDGVAVAMEDSCPHRRIPLSIASLIGDEIRCGYHGMQFDRAGRCTKVPGQAKPNPNAKVVTFPVQERHGLVWVWLGARELAATVDVPDLHWMTDPAWFAVTGYLHVAADYRLATDNLLDLSHETYVHSHTIGNAAVADNPVRVDVVSDRMVRAHREIPDQSPPPFIAATVGTDENINRWQTAIYMPPGMHMTEAGIYPVSQSRDRASVTRVLHLLTPETAHSTHYFWGMCRNYRVAERSLDGQIKQGLDKTFDEDRVVLEIQERRLREEGYPQIPVAAIKFDEAPVRARRLLAAMTAREQDDPNFVSPPITMATDRPAIAA